MEWLNRLNNSLDYIEEHIDDKIEYEELARIACCSVYHFQRMFSYMAEMPLSEYIRCRRLTKAAFDLQRGDKVIDVALRYGYDSPTAFNRAFQKFHNVSPSKAQKEGTYLIAHPPISFKITVKGVERMEYSIVKKGEMRIVGAKIRLSRGDDGQMSEGAMEENFKMVPEFWGTVGQDGRLGKIISMMDSKSKGVLGVSACMANVENWMYYIGVETDKDIVEGLEEYVIPATTWAIFKGRGAMPTAIQDIEKRIVTEWFPTSGYEYGDGPDIEFYLNQDPVNSEFEVWIPVRESK
ncbi:AraC family transcriptional regulator [Intestinibacter sp.]